MMAARPVPARGPCRPDVRSRLDGKEGLNDKLLLEIGIPPLHIVRSRDDETGREALIELSGDVDEFFGSTKK